MPYRRIRNASYADPKQLQDCRAPLRCNSGLRQVRQRRWRQGEGRWAPLRDQMSSIVLQTASLHPVMNSARPPPASGSGAGAGRGRGRGRGRRGHPGRCKPAEVWERQQTYNFGGAMIDRTKQRLANGWLATGWATTEGWRRWRGRGRGRGGTKARLPAAELGTLVPSGDMKLSSRGREAPLSPAVAARK